MVRVAHRRARLSPQAHTTLLTPSQQLNSTVVGAYGTQKWRFSRVGRPCRRLVWIQYLATPVRQYSSDAYCILIPFDFTRTRCQAPQYLPRNIRRRKFGNWSLQFRALYLRRGMNNITNQLKLKCHLRRGLNNIHVVSNPSSGMLCIHNSTDGHQLLLPLLAVDSAALAVWPKRQSYTSMPGSIHRCSSWCTIHRSLSRQSDS
jgi:hypothetical protein